EEIYLVTGIAQIHRVDAIRVAAAALSCGRIDDVVDDIERIRLAVGRNERDRRRENLAIGRVQLVQPPVPRDRVDGVLAGRARRRNDRSRGLAAGTQRTASPASGGRRPGAVEMLLPDDLALLHIDGEEVIADAGDDGGFAARAANIQSA